MGPRHRRSRRTPGASRRPSSATRDPAWPAVKPDYVLVALPVQHVRETLEHFPPPGVPVLSLSKGLEIATGERVSQIITEVWNEPRVAALSGPTFASEIAAGLPAICTIAARGRTTGEGIPGHSPPAEFPHLQLGRSRSAWNSAAR